MPPWYRAEICPLVRSCLWSNERSGSVRSVYQTKLVRLEHGFDTQNVAIGYVRI